MDNPLGSAGSTSSSSHSDQQHAEAAFSVAPVGAAAAGPAAPCPGFESKLKQLQSMHNGLKHVGLTHDISGFADVSLHASQPGSFEHHMAKMQAMVVVSRCIEAGEMGPELQQLQAAYFQMPLYVGLQRLAATQQHPYIPRLLEEADKLMGQVSFGELDRRHHEWGNRLMAEQKQRWEEHKSKRAGWSRRVQQQQQ